MKSPSTRSYFVVIVAIALVTLLAAAPSANAQCVSFVLQHFTGGGTVACPCFVPGEEAGAVFDLPAAHYPIEILRIGVGWGSQLGGAPQTIEESLKVYAGGLPNPGAPIFDIAAPQLTDADCHARSEGEPFLFFGDLATARQQPGATRGTQHR